MNKLEALQAYAAIGGLVCLAENLELGKGGLPLAVSIFD